MRDNVATIVLIAAALFAPALAHADQRDWSPARFDSVGSAGSYTVVVVPGARASVHAEGVREDLERMEVNVEDGRLEVRPQRHWLDFDRHSHGRVTVTVTAPVPIVAASVAGSGTMTLARVDAPRFSGTRADGEGGQPRFPGAWVNALAENPKAAFAAVAARAAALNEREYVAASLALTEHPRLADPSTGEILEAPFGVTLPPVNDNKCASSAPSASPGHLAPPTGGVADIPVKIKDPNVQWEQQPATDAMRRIIADARAVPNPDWPRGVAARTTRQLHHRGRPHDGHPHLPACFHRARGSRRGLGQPVPAAVAAQRDQQARTGPRHPTRRHRHRLQPRPAARRVGPGFGGK